VSDRGFDRALSLAFSIPAASRPQMRGRSKVQRSDVGAGSSIDGAGPYGSSAIASSEAFGDGSVRRTVAVQAAVVRPAEETRTPTQAGSPRSSAIPCRHHSRERTCSRTYSSPSPVPHQRANSGMEMSAAGTCCSGLWPRTGSGCPEHTGEKKRVSVLSYLTRAPECPKRMHDDRLWHKVSRNQDRAEIRPDPEDHQHRSTIATTEPATTEIRGTVMRCRGGAVAMSADEPITWIGTITNTAANSSLEMRKNTLI
jgi:hypothetical protein